MRRRLRARRRDRDLRRGCPSLEVIRVLLDRSIWVVPAAGRRPERPVELAVPRASRSRCSRSGPRRCRARCSDFRVSLQKLYVWPGERQRAVVVDRRAGGRSHARSLVVPVPADPAVLRLVAADRVRGGDPGVVVVGRRVALVDRGQRDVLLPVDGRVGLGAARVLEVAGVPRGQRELLPTPTLARPHCLAFELSVMSPSVAVPVWIRALESRVISSCGLHLVVREDLLALREWAWRYDPSRRRPAVPVADDLDAVPELPGGGRAGAGASQTRTW